MAPSETPPDDAPPDIAGYEEFSLLGYGGFSRVWRATSVEDGSVYAIKVSLTRNDLRFAREAQAMRTLGSEVCPRIHREGVCTANFPYIAMEVLEGHSLGHWLATSEHRIPERPEAVLLFERLCDAVQRMHDRELLHRDLKPENVMLLESGELRLMDLGLARGIHDEPLGDEVAQGSLTQTGAMLGTAAYIAPEQSLGRRNLGFAADIYSLAVMAFELLTGRLPFWGSRSSILQAHTWHRPPPASKFAGLNANVDEVIAKGLAKDPRNRWSSAAEFTEQLTNAVATLPVASQKLPPVESRPRRREMALLAITGNTQNLAETTRVALSVGGQVARTSEDGILIVFASAQTVKRGVTAAVALANESFDKAERAVVHVALVRSRKGKRGTMVMGDAIKKYQAWAADYGPGLHATPDAAPYVSHSQLARKDERGRLVLRGRKSAPPTNTGIRVDWHSMSMAVQFWGRRELVEDLERDARECIDSGTPTITTVTGDVGMGKTQLARHLLDRVGAWKSVRVIQVRAAAEDEHRGDALQQRLVREAFELFSAHPTFDEVKTACRAKLPPRLAEQSTPAVARALEVISPEEFAKRSPLAGATAIRQALARAIAEALLYSAKQHPIALLIDDVHRADFTTLDAIEMTTLSNPRVPVWVLAVATPALFEVRQNWGARAGATKTYELGPLQREEAKGMLKQLLFPVEFIPEQTLTALIELTDGIPLHLEEVANALKRGGVIRKREGTESWIIASDELMRASQTPLGERLAKASLSGLREDLAKFAQLCAVTGRKIGLREMDQVQAALEPGLGYSELAASAGISHLVEKKILRRSGADRFEFRHPMTRDALEAKLPRALRSILHAAVLSTLPRDSTPPARIAHHAERAGEAQLAAAMYLHVATAAEARYRYVEAEQAYTAALANLSPDDRAGQSQARAGRARVHYCVGRHDDALADLEAAMANAPKTTTPIAMAEMLLEKATILDWKFQYAESAAAANLAAERIQGVDDPAIRLKSDLASARSHFRGQEFQRSIPELEAAADRAEELEDHTSHVISLALLGAALVAVDRLDEAQACLDRMIRLSRRVGDRLHLAVAYANRMLVWMARHDYENAVRDAGHAAAIANGIGSFPVIWVSQHSKAQLLLWLGRHDEAARIAAEARELQHRFTNTPDPADTLLVARINVASSDERGAAESELAYINAHHQFDALVPLHKKQLGMLRLWQSQASADEWNELLDSAEGIFETNEMLEFLLLYARAAHCEQRMEDVEKATMLAHRLVDPASHWIRIFRDLSYKRFR